MDTTHFTRMERMWHGGEQARRSGAATTSNPFIAGSDANLEWLRGWHERDANPTPDTVPVNSHAPVHATCF